MLRQDDSGRIRRRRKRFGVQELGQMLGGFDLRDRFAFRKFVTSLRAV